MRQLQWPRDLGIECLPLGKRGERRSGGFAPSIARRVRVRLGATTSERGRSKHIELSMPYLPRIARRLYQARDLGQPFDFLTWFEFAPEHEGAFDDLLGVLRGREEWTFVDREVEIRVSRPA